MIRLDVLTRLRDSGRKDGRTEPSGSIEIDPADHEEPTWDVRHPAEAQRRRLDGRTRAILSVAAVAALVVNAGAAWIYWQITGTQSDAGSAPAVVELTLHARSDVNRPLLPGQTGNLAVTVTNEHDFPIRITTVTRGAGAIVADEAHRNAGCRQPGAEMTRSRFEVSWAVPRNTIGAFTIPDALVLPAGAAPTCGGATFTVPIQASGVSRRAS